MDIEPLNAACFILMVVVTCCIVKLLHMVRKMQAPGNQGPFTEPTRTIHDQSVLGTAKESIPRRSGAVERTEQHGNTTRSDVTARRRHPQEHEKRFSQQTKTIV